MNTDKIIEEIVLSPSLKKLDMAFSSLAAAFTSSGNKIRSGFGLDLSPSGMLESERSAKAAENFITSVISGGASLASALYAKQYVLNFDYVKEPALQAAANSMGGYFDVLARAVGDRERLAQQYRMMALSSGVSATASLATIVGRQVASSIVRSAAVSGASAGAAAGAASQVGLRGAAMAALARSLGTFGVLGPVGAALAAGTLIWTTVSLAQNAAKNRELTEIAENKALMDLFNPKGLMALYQKNAFLLGSEMDRGQRGGMELLIGTDWEDSLERGEIPSVPNSLSGRIYNAAFSGSYSENAVGFDVRQFGFNSEKVLDVSGNLDRNLQTGANENLVAQILMTSGLYTGGDTSLMESISTQIVRSSGFTDKDVNEATERFEEFFSAVVGDGKPQGSHLKLVSALSSFSYDYAMGVKGNLGATTEIAKIQQFMGDNGEINGRFDVTASTTAMTSIDEILLMGATFQDLNAARIVSTMGISREDAIRGVTYDANTFDNFLGGLTSFLSVSNADIINRTEKFEVGLQNFALMTGVNAPEINALMVALTNYAEGKRVEDIRVSYMENIADDATNKFEKFSEKFEGTYSALKTVGNIVYSSNKMLDAVNKNLETFKTFQSIMDDVINRGIVLAVGSFITAMRNIMRLPREPAFLQIQANQLSNELGLGTIDYSVQGAPELAEARGNLTAARELNRRPPDYENALPYGDTTPRLGFSTVDEFANMLPDEAASSFLNIVYENDLGLVIDENFIRRFREVLSSQPQDIQNEFPDSLFDSEEPAPAPVETTTTQQENIDIYNQINSVLGEEGRRNFTAEFFEQAKVVADNLGIPLEYLLTVIHFETAGTFSATIQPTRRDGTLISSAIGLIQFLSSTAEGLGTTTEQLAQMTPIQQLAYVEAYFKQHQNKIKPGMSLEDVYLIVFTPAASGKPSDHVLYTRGSAGYDANEGLDKNLDGKITKMEITSKIRDRYEMVIGQDRATGGMVFPSKDSNLNNNSIKNKNMHINIPIISSSPNKTASDFVKSMSNLLGM